MFVIKIKAELDAKRKITPKSKIFGVYISKATLKERLKDYKKLQLLWDLMLNKL